MLEIYVGMWKAITKQSTVSFHLSNQFIKISKWIIGDNVARDRVDLIKTKKKKR